MSTNRTKDQTDDLTHAAATLGHQAVDSAEKHVAAATESISATYKQGVKHATKAQDAVEDYVQSNPLKSLLIAGGAGLLIGMWMSRRSD